jgi:glucan phosphoethanolaminetransferase (alkaline phosphatase superfamily)
MADVALSGLRRYAPRARINSGREFFGKISLVVALIALTNTDFPSRIALLLEQGRTGVIAVTLGIWAIALACLMAAALHPSKLVRGAWAFLMALSAAALLGYSAAAKTDLTIFDVLVLWDARHDAQGATEVYRNDIYFGAAWFILALLILAMPPSLPARIGFRAKAALAILPAVPVLAIAAVIALKGGNGSAGMPKQFLGASFGILAAEKLALHPTPDRLPVAWKPDTGNAVNHIVMLIDESIRYDYLDFSPGNPHTPGVADAAARFVNFGPAASGGVCSNYSNSLLRHAASRKDITGTVNANPSLFAYAKKAGYRTVYIDAQAMTVANPNLLQNFMTPDERADIDGFYPITDPDRSKADDALLDILAKELNTGAPVFIYANKLGAHIPYDTIAPDAAKVYGPTETEAGETTYATRIASYRNAIRWGTDRFMGKLFGAANFSDAALIYTSDHSQLLDPERLTHCGVENADPRMALVPMLAYADNANTMGDLQRGARRSAGKASHFQIAPTILAFMGYRPDDIGRGYDESLTLGTAREPGYTSGDVFGLFSATPRWNPIDLGRSYIEPEAADVLPKQGVAGLAH